ncbi:TRAP transporter substrate-binding protein [Roseomonas sp. OT10]|uniref:TAXI family TRAP transporter solute-binding subunit n=1 Tax=Roseomonas cutis TaxID=2897332 RepID=UPI001E5F116F|nr:TAXI family TRAP transporter solute-binding subunit [Roseomonas sp. OT10]UFN48998.1 TRAP transporter substrate-binding protein [Roseomonas sp. OT10]
MTTSGATRRGLLLAPALLPAGQALAQPQPAAPPPAAARPAPPRSMAEAVNRANAGTVGVVSGGVDGTYIRIAADLAAVLDEGDRLRVLPILGKGSVQNLGDIAYLRGIDIGIVQSDSLAFVRRERLLPGADGLIRYIAKLYDEEVHLLAGPGVERIEDLAGKPVNVDVRGSGTAMTASLIFESLGIPVRVTNDTQDLAVQKLRSGEIAALVYVAGKPARLFSALPAGTGLRFLSVPMTPALLETYLPSRLGAGDYPNLVAEDAPVETVAVGAIMAVYAWQPGSERHAKVMRFVDSFTKRFPALLRPPRHPKWREVNLGAQAPGWVRFQTAAAPAAVPRSPSRRRREGETAG